MARGGPVPDSSAALLLTAAAAVDVVIVLALVKMLAPLADPFLYFIDPVWRVAVLFMPLLLIGWIICEIVLGGHSPGRFVLGMELCDDKGNPLPTSKKLSRGLRKLATLGVTGMNPVKPASYDRKTGVVWHCGIVPPVPRPMGEWQLLFRGGSYGGKKSSLARITGFLERGEVRFGREKAWANVVMTRDERVSGRHCSLIVHNGKLYLRDGDGAGKPSSNGTWLAGRKLVPGETRAIENAQFFHIADIRVDIKR
jgi:hypothetical protein